MSAVQLKDPAAAVDYAVDWSAALPAGAALAGAAWSVAPDEPGGVRVRAAAVDGAVAVALATGGVAGRRYRLTCAADLGGGRADRRSIVVRVGAR